MTGLAIGVVLRWVVVLEVGAAVLAVMGVVNDSSYNVGRAHLQILDYPMATVSLDGSEVLGTDKGMDTCIPISVRTQVRLQLS